MGLIERAGAIRVICRVGMILSQLTLVGCLVPARLGATRGTFETVPEVQLVEGEQESELFSTSWPSCRVCTTAGRCFHHVLHRGE